MAKNPMAVFDAARQSFECDSAALPLNLEKLFDRYSTEGRYLPDGVPKTERYLQHVRQTGRYLAMFFGANQLVSDLTPDRIHDYVVWRRKGACQVVWWEPTRFSVTWGCSRRL